MDLMKQTILENILKMSPFLRLNKEIFVWCGLSGKTGLLRNQIISQTIALAQNHGGKFWTSDYSRNSSEAPEKGQFLTKMNLV